MRQKLSSGSQCIPALPGTHNWHASPQTALLISQSNNALYIVTIPEVGLVCCSFACTPPVARTHAHVALTLCHAR
eukprot:1038086-Pelagomonas_calceolata.AAC.1